MPLSYIHKTYIALYLIQGQKLSIGADKYNIRNTG